MNPALSLTLPSRATRTRVALSAGVLTLALGAPAAADAASIWTPVASGTGEDITTVSHRAERTVFGTAAGKIFTLDGGLRMDYGGAANAVVDLKMNPAGDRGIAVLKSGKVATSADGGVTWSAPGSLTQLVTYYPNAQGCGAGEVRALEPITKLPTSVNWASNTKAYITTQNWNSLLETVSSGAGWSEINRNPNGTCNLAGPAGTGAWPTDIAPVLKSDRALPATELTMIHSGFGQLRRTTDGFTTPPAIRAEPVNCFDHAPSLALDQETPTHMIAGDECTGDGSVRYSADGGATFTTPTIYPRTPDVGYSGIDGIYDVALEGRTMMWVGNAGDVYTSRDGVSAFRQPGPGGFEATDWRAVSAYSGANAAVAGAGGALMITTAADTIPDLTTPETPADRTAPTATIDDPGLPVGGAPTGFHASIADNAGGSGVDPSSIRWFGSGVELASGNPATLTLPVGGPVTVRVTFRDRAGNAGEATRVVRPLTPRGRATFNSRLGALKLQGPRTCVQAGRTFSAEMAFSRSAVRPNRLLGLGTVRFSLDGRLVRVDRTSRFVQRFRTAGMAPGTVHEVTAVGRFRVASGAPLRRTLTVVFAICR